MGLVAQDFPGGVFDAGGEFGGLNDAGVATPTEDPTFDFGQARETQTQLDSAVLQFA